MKEQHGETELLEDDAFEAQEEEERRRNEWIVEREIRVAPLAPLDDGVDARRRRRQTIPQNARLRIARLSAVRVDLPVHQVACARSAGSGRAVRQARRHRDAAEGGAAAPATAAAEAAGKAGPE